MVMVGAAGDVAVDVAVKLHAPRDAGGDQAVQRPERGGSADAHIPATQPIVELLRGDLAPGAGECIGHEQPLTRDAQAGPSQPLGDGPISQCPPTAPAKAEKA